MAGFILFDYHTVQKPLCFLDFLAFLLRTANIPGTIFKHLNFTNNQVFRLEKTNSEKHASSKDMPFFPDLGQSIYKSKFHVSQTGFCN